MDLRLQHVPPGVRARTLLASDVPVVSQALTLALRGRAVVHPGVDRGVRYMWITGERVNLTVLEEDWQKIRPFFADGTFDPSSAPKGMTEVDMERDPLYQRVLAALTPIFTKDFP